MVIREGDNVFKKEVYYHFLGQYHDKFPREVMGFEVGDIVRLSDGDGRPHVIKRFDKVDNGYKPFYHVTFEDNTARDIIFPDEYPFITHMIKIEQ